MEHSSHELDYSGIRRLDDVTHIISGLNDKQLEAVTAEPGPLLVLAGAGSGKTRVLTHRIALLLHDRTISPARILAVTFTNKAAREMQERVQSLLRDSVGGMYIGTFHGMSNRILRTHCKDAGLSRDFEIIASADQKRLITEIMKGMERHALANLPSPNRVQWRINTLKEAGIRANGNIELKDHSDELIVAIYRQYEKRCESERLVDFAELLLRVVELMQNNVTVREKYQEQFRHVLIDEYQDTNALQYEWLRLFSARHKSITAVGDDDQSIYGWRGARVENMLQFEKTYPGARVIRLEQNYRSTKSILNAANAMIKHNSSRLGKSLWTESDEGVPVQLFTSYNEVEEAGFVTNQVVRLRKSGIGYSDFAILYRTNAQSQVFEEEFRRERIPHQVYGGTRFYDRLEVKIILAYLRLLVNRNANVSYYRAVNNPPRGVGPAALDAVSQFAAQENLSLWDATARIIEEQKYPQRTVRPLLRFVDIIEKLAAEVENLPLPKLIAKIIQTSTLQDYYQGKKTLEAESRIENLDELKSAATRFANEVESDDNTDILDQYLDVTSLDSGDRHLNSEGHVQLMTLHSSKGLEFPVVFLTGLIEGLLPHMNSMHSEKQIEEERRLCYVGMTRAIRQLYLTRSRTRTFAGEYASGLRLSRFVKEVPPELIQSSNVQFEEFATASTSARKTNGVGVGDNVIHHSFGIGVVLEIRKLGSDSLAQVRFSETGTKWIMSPEDNLKSV